MSSPPASVEQLLELAIRLVNAGQASRARQLCEHARLQHPPHPAVLQLLARLQLEAGAPVEADASIAESLALRPDHGPSLLLGGDIARANGDVALALARHERAVELLPGREQALNSLGLTLKAAGREAEAARALRRAAALAPAHGGIWFELALVLQDLRDFDGAAEALRQVLRVSPPRAEVEVNLGIVLQEAGRMEEAMQAYGRACRLNADTFGRIAHALATAPTGRLWLDLDELRAALLAAPA
ncbi:tetratricopeptide repeat protein [Variovorax sp. CAN2819]|uniref:tetratricopeptide repeat protein n=1 Tax=Variovorax sp. CAN15 TaxID=3046727 RepID=UPI0026490691|nr:tetratricopeptide repeat protein [Variovorax sp. CAN15]MDN6886026.1 tetratricopeptide repeat protein [Variovorax sp. CAN15]